MEKSNMTHRGASQETRPRRDSSVRRIAQPPGGKLIPFPVPPEQREKLRKGFGTKPVKKEAPRADFQEATLDQVKAYVAKEIANTGIHPLWGLYVSWSITNLSISKSDGLADTLKIKNAFKVRIDDKTGEITDSENGSTDASTRLFFEFLRKDGDPEAIVRKVLHKIVDRFGYAKISPLPIEGRRAWAFGLNPANKELKVAKDPSR